MLKEFIELNVNMNIKISEECWIKYKDCKCYLEYVSVKDYLILYKCFWYQRVHFAVAKRCLPIKIHGWLGKIYWNMRRCYWRRR